MLRQPLGNWMLGRNAILMLLGALALIPNYARAMTSLDFATIALGATTLVLLYGAANYLLANAPRSNELKGLTMGTADA